MKPQSAKQKGRKLQQWMRDKLYEHFPLLDPGDVRSTSMGAGGEDLQLSPFARKLFPFTVECKNVEKLNIWAAYDQACEHEDATPIVVFKKNGRDPLVALDAETFIWLMANKSHQNQDGVSS